MIMDHESPADISYVSVTSIPDREYAAMEEEESRLHHYCNCLEAAVMICEVLTLASLALCAFLI